MKYVVNHVGLLLTISLLLALAMLGASQPGEAQAVATVQATATSQPTASAHSPITLSNTRQVKQLARLGQGWISGAAYTPDGKILAVLSSIGVSLYPADTLDNPRFLENSSLCLSMAFSPDGSNIAVGGFDGSVRLWDVKTGQNVKTFTSPAVKGHISAILSMAFSPDGSMIATGGSDVTVRLWNVKSGQLTATLTVNTGSSSV